MKALTTAIRPVLPTRVRPAVAQDGGDITFHGFDHGVVYLTMKGACAGCPSSTMTLKHGIENLLRQVEQDAALGLRAVLLFVGAGVVPMIPGGFLTFADTPLYGIYELAPRVEGIDAGIDQQLAGVLMKIGNVPLLWPAIGVLFARWAKESGGSRSETTLAAANHSV